MGWASALIFILLIGCKIECQNVKCPVKVLVLPVRVETESVKCDKSPELAQIDDLQREVEYWRSLYFSQPACLDNTGP